MRERSSDIVTPERLVFIGGLHRSGTTLLAELLGAHSDISALTGTSVWHDEGQFLQDVVPTAHECGGPGRFAYASSAHLTEADVDDATSIRRCLLDAWQPYWELDRAYLVEKSPPNLLRFRYLQRVFPEALFIAIVRHPVAVAYATAGWAQVGVGDLLDHWLHAHEIFVKDRAVLDRIETVQYEQLVADVPGTLAQLHRAIGVRPEVPAIEVRRDTNERYLRRFRHSRFWPTHPRVLLTGQRYERRLNALGFGYSFHDRP